MASCKSDGIDPELRLKAFAFNMDMRWLVSIAGIEEESAGAGSEYCGHFFVLRSSPCFCNAAQRAVFPVAHA